MARIRTVKPEFWTSEQVVECSPIARLMFIGMWNFCDDAGNHPASYKTLKMEVFPGDEISVAQIEEYANELLRNNLIVKYDGGNGREYWHVTGWHHQKIEKPNFKHPAFNPSKIQKFDNHSSINRRPIADQSTPEGKGMEGNGMEGNVKEENLNNPPIPPLEEKKDTPSDDGRDGADYLFNIFWSHYPRKVKKFDAKKAFKKIKRPSETVEKIIFALAWQKESYDWTKDGGRYIPYPATYLNGGQWEDEKPPDNVMNKRRQEDFRNKKFDPLDSIYGGDGFGNKRETESRIIDIDGTVAYEEPKIQKLISH